MVRFFQPPEIRVGYLGIILDGEGTNAIADKKFIRSAIKLKQSYATALGKYDQIINMLVSPVATYEKFYAPELVPTKDHKAVYELEQLQSTPEFIYAVQNILDIHILGRHQSQFINNYLNEFLSVLKTVE